MTDSSRPLFTVAVCTGRDEQEAFFMRWLSVHRALKAGDNRAVPSDLHKYPALKQLFLDCIDPRDGSFLVPTLRALAHQTFRDFEVLVVDCALPTRPHYEVPAGIPSFRVVPPRDTPWLHEPWPDGYEPCPVNWHVKWPIGCCARNTAIVHAQGQRLVIMDDCMVFGPDYLARMAEHIEQGILPGSARRIPIVWPDHGVGSRPDRVQWEPWIEMVKPYSLEQTDWPEHSGCPFPLEAWLAVNGYDETLDPVLSLDDADVQMRMGQWGKQHNCAAMNDPELIMWELGHYHFHWMRYAARHNGLLLGMIQERWPNRIRANDARPDAAFWNEYRERLSDPVKWNCGYTPNFALTPPPFDLAAERRALGNWTPG